MPSLSTQSPFSSMVVALILTVARPDWNHVPFHAGFKWHVPVEYEKRNRKKK